MKSLLVDYANHNLWVTKIYVEILQKEDVNILEKEIISSFPSIMKTLAHIHAAQNIWHDRLNNLKGTFPSYESFDGADQIFAACIVSAESLLNFIEKSSEKDLIVKKSFHLLNGDKMENTVCDMFMHCINHSNFHRGQLVTMMRQMGINTIPSTDFIKYKRMII